MTTSTEQPAGPILDGLGVTVTLAEGDLISSAVVICKVINSEGEVSLCISDSEGLSWVDQIGLVHAAIDIIGGGRYERRFDDD